MSTMVQRQCVIDAILSRPPLAIVHCQCSRAPTRLERTRPRRLRLYVFPTLFPCRPFGCCPRLSPPFSLRGMNARVIQSHHCETVPTHNEPQTARLAPLIKVRCKMCLWENAYHRSCAIFGGSMGVDGGVFERIRPHPRWWYGLCFIIFRVRVQFSELWPSCPLSTRHYQTTAA